MIKRYLLTLLTLIGLAAVPALAADTLDTGGFKHPGSLNASQPDNPGWKGVDFVYRIEIGTATLTPVQLFDGSAPAVGAAGSAVDVVGASCSSGTAGDFMVLFASNSVSGLSGVDGINAQGSRISPKIWSAAAQGTCTAGQNGCGDWRPPLPIPVTDLVGNRVGTANCEVYVRKRR
jgi:hypothetical protein